jgi:hypothetical protein
VKEAATAERVQEQLRAEHGLVPVVREDEEIEEEDYEI